MRVEAAEVLEERILLAGQKVNLDNVTPDIYGPQVALFGNSDGGYASSTVHTAGRYRVAYVGGALRLSPDHGFTTRSGSDGYHALWNGGSSDAVLPGAYNRRSSSDSLIAGYDTQGEAEAATDALNPRYEFTHNGGAIGVQFIDAPYSDNLAGAPNPSYHLLRLNATPRIFAQNATVREDAAVNSLVAPINVTDPDYVDVDYLTVTADTSYTPFRLDGNNTDGYRLLVARALDFETTPELYGGQIADGPRGYRIDLTVSDGELTDTHTMIVTVLNVAPVARADNYDVATGWTLNVTAAEGVLNNDDEPGGQKQAVIKTTAQHGSVNLNLDGSFEYVPEEDYEGSDSFTYQASDGHARSLETTVSLTVTDVTPTVGLINYLNGQDITADPGGAGGGIKWDKQHWLDNDYNGSAEDAGDHKYAVAYERGKTLKLYTRLKLENAWNGRQPLKMHLKAIGSDGINIAPTLANTGRQYVTLSNVAAANPFPNYVDHYDDFVLNWKYSLDGGATWKDAGQTANDLYLTLGVPTVTTLYHTVVHLGSDNARGQTDAAGVVRDVWREFSDRSVSRVDGTRLTYWVKKGMCTATNTAELLQQIDGQCGSWAELLRDVLKGQGIAGVQKILVLSQDFVRTGNSSYGFLVKNWKITGAGTNPRTAPYKYVVGTDAFADKGVAAQGNDDPPPSFFNHFIVQYGGRYYDPSYGGGTYADQNAWENASLAGFYFQRLPRTISQALVKLNDPLVVETFFRVV